MRFLLTKLSVVLICCVCASNLKADFFNVSDGDFVDGVFEFRYYSDSNKAFVNGAEINYSSLVLTSSGITGPVSEGAGEYWEATGHFNATQLAGFLTMGWDLSTVSQGLSKVEILSNAAIFQFDPWAPHAFEDIVFGELATPTTFGSSPYTRYFEYEGDNNGAIGAYANVGLVQDVTSSLSSGWLNDPTLLELRLGYQQHAIDSTHPNIPGKHIQFFRGQDSTGDQSFLLRITAVPEPSTFALLNIGAVGMTVVRRRKKRITAS